jgi:hypothetical protein
VKQDTLQVIGDLRHAGLSFLVFLKAYLLGFRHHFLVKWLFSNSLLSSCFWACGFSPRSLGNGFVDGTAFPGAKFQ